MFKNTINNIEINLISKEDLIVLKRLSARPQDNLDVANIYKKYIGAIDDNYITKWFKYYKK